MTTVAVDAFGVLPQPPEVGAMVVNVDLTRPKKHKPSLGKAGNLQLTPFALVSQVNPKVNNVTFEDPKIASINPADKPFKARF